MTTKNTGMEILNVTVQRVKNTSENFSVFTGRDDDAGIHTVKAFIGPVRQMQRWCVAGREVDDQRWGKQFVAQFATLAAPRDERELESFLTSGHVEGWGYHEYYGMLNQAGYDPFRMCSEHPEDLAELGCITSEMIASLRAAWTRGSGLAPVYAQLVDWGC